VIVLPAAFNMRSFVTRLRPLVGGVQHVTLGGAEAKASDNCQKVVKAADMLIWQSSR
jgi:hypothetical protein